MSRFFTQAEFDEFARLSGDDNPIHVDPAFAARTPFGGTVAHGMLVFSVFEAEVSRWRGDELRLAEQRLMLPAPTLAGAPVTVEFTAEGPTLRSRIVDGAGTTAVIGSAR